jgi:cysteine-rich repeat protein
MWGGNEQCDDGNATSGDGCSSDCQLEPNYSCNYLGEPCEPVVCGDGVQHSYVQPDGTYAYEVCDDGNTASGDGCSSVCDQEPGWICDQPGVACRQPECGDGRQDSWFVPGPGGGSAGSSSGGSGSGGGGPGGTYYYEECDDGNAASGDGCASSCTIEAGWICSEPGVPCREPVCGDGFVDFIAQEGGGGSSAGSTSAGSSSGGASSAGSGGASAGVGGAAGSGPTGFFEGCDDGGTVPGDGCDSTCSVEAGWSCPYWDGLPCRIIVCGDGWTDWPTEECDDANEIPNDGCTSCTYDNSGSGGSAGGGFGGGSSGAGGFAPGGFGG